MEIKKREGYFLMTPAADVEVRDEFTLFLEQNLNKELLRFTTLAAWTTAIPR